MPRPILIVAAVGALLTAKAVEAVPEREAALGELSAEQLDAVSTWAITGAVLVMVGLIFLLGNGEDDLIPVSP